MMMVIIGFWGDSLTFGGTTFVIPYEQDDLRK
jgi:hypothetical protein